MSRKYHTFQQQSQYAQLVSYIRRGQVGEVSDMLEDKTSLGWSLLRQRDRINRTILHHAADSNANDNQLKIVQLILRAAPAELIEAQDTEGNTALHLSVIDGNVSLVRLLLQKMSPAQVNIADYELHTAVHWAVVCGQLACLQLLLEAGAILDTPDIYGAYPLHYATQSVWSLGDYQFGGRLGKRGTTTQQQQQQQRRWTADTLRILHYLLATRLHLDVNCTDNEARTPLIWSASSGNHEALHALVKAGAEISQQDKEGLTALHCASSRGHYKCVEILVMICGADVHQTDGSGCTPLFYATALGHADCVRLLIESGAHLDHQDNKGRTAAHCGASKGQLETLRILHQHNANLWLKNVRGDLPLHEAVKSGRKDLVRWLLDLNRKSVNEVNLYGRSALHIAAFNNNLELCKLLVEEYGADANAVMKVRTHYLTPLDAAHQNAADEVAEYLHGVGGRPIAQINKRVEEYLQQQSVNESAHQQLDHFVGFGSSFEENEEYRQLRERYVNYNQKKKANTFTANEIKLPNLVTNDKSGGDDSEKTFNGGEKRAKTTRALSNTSTASSPRLTADNVHNVREFDQHLNTCGHHHLRQAIITNVYLTTATPPALLSSSGQYVKRTPAPLRRTKKLKKAAGASVNATRINETIGEKAQAEAPEESFEDEVEEDEDNYPAGSHRRPVKVTINAKDTFVSVHETREDRVEVNEYLPSTAAIAGGTTVLIESLTRTGLEGDDEDLHGKTKQISVDDEKDEEVGDGEDKEVSDTLSEQDYYKHDKFEENDQRSKKISQQSVVQDSLNYVPEEKEEGKEKEEKEEEEKEEEKEEEEKEEEEKEEEEKEEEEKEEKEEEENVISQRNKALRDKRSVDSIEQEEEEEDLPHVKSALDNSIDRAENIQKEKIEVENIRTEPLSMIDEEGDESKMETTSESAKTSRQSTLTGEPYHIDKLESDEENKHLREAMLKAQQNAKMQRVHSQDSDTEKNIEIEDDDQTEDKSEEKQSQIDYKPIDAHGDTDQVDDHKSISYDEKIDAISRKSIDLSDGKKGIDTDSISNKSVDIVEDFIDGKNEHKDDDSIDNKSIDRDDHGNALDEVIQNVKDDVNKNLNINIDSIGDKSITDEQEKLTEDDNRVDNKQSIGESDNLEKDDKLGRKKRSLDSEDDGKHQFKVIDSDDLEHKVKDYIEKVVDEAKEEAIDQVGDKEEDDTDHSNQRQKVVFEDEEQSNNITTLKSNKGKQPEAKKIRKQSIVSLKSQPSITSHIDEFRDDDKENHDKDTSYKESFVVEENVSTRKDSLVQLGDKGTLPKESLVVKSDKDKLRRNSLSIVDEKEKPRKGSIVVGDDKDESLKDSPAIVEDEVKPRNESLLIDDDEDKSQKHSLTVWKDKENLRRGSLSVGDDRIKSRRDSSTIIIDNNQKDKRWFEANVDEDQSRDFRDNGTYLREGFDDDDEAGELSDAALSGHSYSKDVNFHDKYSSDKEHEDGIRGPARKVNRQYAHIGPKVDTFWDDRHVDRQPPQLKRHLKSSSQSLNRSHSKSLYLNTAKEDYQQINPAIIQQTVEKYIRKYYLERKLFEELYDLKRYQIRTGRSNEPQMVKRLADQFRRDVRAPGMSDFKGPYTYRAYEMFLYDQLRHLSRSNEKKVAYLTKSISLEDMNISSSSFDDYYDRWEEGGRGDGSATIGEDNRTRLDYEKREAGASIDYKYEYHKSQHYDKHSNDLVDVTLENLYKRTGFDGQKVDEMAITRKSVERRGKQAKADKQNGKDNKQAGDDKDGRILGHVSRGTSRGNQSRQTNKQSDKTATKENNYSYKKKNVQHEIGSDSGVADSGHDTVLLESTKHTDKVGTEHVAKLSKHFHSRLLHPNKRKVVATMSTNTKDGKDLMPKRRIRQRSVIPPRQYYHIAPEVITARWHPIKTAQKRQLCKGRVWTSPAVNSEYGNILLWYEINKPWHYLRYDQLDLLTQRFRYGGHQHRYAIAYTPPFDHYHQDGHNKKTWNVCKLNRTHSDTALSLCAHLDAPTLTF